MERPAVPLIPRTNVTLPISKDGLNWICVGQSCRTPCCGRFEGPNVMLKSIVGLEADSIILLPDEAHWLSINFPDRIQHEASLSQIRLRADGSCFEDGRCSIYEYRPRLCRAYPLYVDLGAGVSLDTRCPGINQGWTPVPVAVTMMNDLARVIQFHLGIALDFLLSAVQVDAG